MAAASILGNPGRSGAQRRRIGVRLAALACVLLLTACTAKPVVPSNEFPKPVLRKIALPMGLYMDETFVGYVHHEKPLEGGPTRDVSVGPASRALFGEFLAAQFSPLVTVTRAPAPQSVAPGVQAVLQPVVQEVQIASPKTDKEQFHEAWIKYRLRLLTPQGREITTWDLAAYGKQRSNAMGRTNVELAGAVRDAMRDAAAGMALIFRDGNAFRARVATASTPTPVATP